jgi:hypothetical protein
MKAADTQQPQERASDLPWALAARAGPFRLSAHSKQWQQNGSHRSQVTQVAGLRVHTVPAPLEVCPAPSGLLGHAAPNNGGGLPAPH